MQCIKNITRNSEEIGNQIQVSGRKTGDAQILGIFCFNLHLSDINLISLFHLEMKYIRVYKKQISQMD